MKVAIIVLGFLALMGASVLAEPTPINASQTREEFAAVGQMPTIAGSTMVGPGATADITISVDNYSSDDEARTIVAAFAKGKHKALRSALAKASVKARITFVGRNGFYELKLLRSTKTPNGRQVFGIGEKSIRFLDAYYSGRWHLEEFGILQLELTTDNGVEEGSGAMIHKAQIKSLTADSISLDNHGIEPVRLTVRRQ
ncbi:MAG TPA: hypothetical protein VHQ64_18365 [Pyrinomonadaceae bacterium]|jgi:hypothetical protein|nr:hypothetical protein [Pyrinomonadaceae bacterium]